jgi:hypothetical protein
MNEVARQLISIAILTGAAPDDGGDLESAPGAGDR